MRRGFGDKVEEAKSAMSAFISSPYHRRAVFLLIGKEESGKTYILREFGKEKGKEVVNVSLRLAQKVKEKNAPPWRWESLLREEWRALMEEIGEGDYALYDNIDIFYKFPGVNFLSIAEEVCQIQKRRKAIIAFPGYIAEGGLYFWGRRLGEVNLRAWMGRFYDLND